MGVFGKGKSYKKHFYTIQDISKLSGRAEGTIRNDSSSGKVDLDNMESVIRYILNSYWLGGEHGR